MARSRRTTTAIDRRRLCDGAPRIDQDAVRGRTQTIVGERCGDVEVALDPGEPSAVGDEYRVGLAGGDVGDESRSVEREIAFVTAARVRADRVLLERVRGHVRDPEAGKRTDPDTVDLARQRVAERNVRADGQQPRMRAD